MMPVAAPAIDCAMRFISLSFGRVVGCKSLSKNQKLTRANPAKGTYWQ
jgi:hypothetical protein